MQGQGAFVVCFAWLGVLVLVLVLDVLGSFLRAGGS